MTTTVVGKLGGEEAFIEMTTQHTMQMYARNSSYVIPGVYDIEMHDAGWILVASIMIFRCLKSVL